MKPTILIIEDDVELAGSHRDNLKEFYDVKLAFDPDSGLKAAKDTGVSLVVLDLGFPSDVSVGLGMIPKLKNINPNIKIIVTTGFGGVEIGAKAIELGAYNYLEKPVRDYHGFLVIIEQAFSIIRLEGEINGLQSKTERENSFCGIIGVSGIMQGVFESVRRVAGTDANVLIQGETGTGKELVARAIHQLSSKVSGPFVVVNCAAIPETMLEDKLFGHEKGAFTGAYARQLGAIEFAAGGTIFLDEIGEMQPLIQVKLLRFLQHKNFQRLGGNKDINVDVRAVAATNRNLEHEVGEGRFREDLYYRLNVYPINVPPLRKRKEDISMMVSYFLKKFSSQLGKNVRNVHPSAIDMLMSHHWSGNVRELENVIQRAILAVDGDTIWSAHLKGLGAGDGRVSLENLTRNFQELWIREAYARNFGDAGKTAKELGISKRQLQRYNKRYMIDKEIYASDSNEI